MSPKRFPGVFRLAAREPNVPRDVEQEIKTHLDELTDWLVENGWKPDAARAEATRRFGDQDRFRQELRAIDRSVIRRRRFRERLESWWQDLAFAARGLRRAPGYAVVVIGTLGVALGANATMFGIIDRLLLRPPPGIVAPSELRRVTVARWSESGLSTPWDEVSYPSFEGLRDHGTGFSHVAAIGPEGRLSLGLGREAREVNGVFATGQYFDLLGVVPHLGRLFHDSDDQPPRGNQVAVLSYRFWRDGMGADPAIVGRRLVLNGQSFEVVGVSSPEFQGTELSRVDLWVPLSNVDPLTQQTADWRTGRGWQWLTLLVRLKPGMTERDALGPATQAYQAANTGFAPMEAKAVPNFRAITDYSGGSSGSQIALWLYGVTVVVLLIACANVANVVLARGTVRRTETAVRQALGVSSTRLVRQFAVETMLVMSLGLMVGLVLTRWGGLLVRKVLLSTMVWDADPVNLRVLGATALAAVVAAFLASLWPLWRGSRVDLAGQLHGAGRTAGGAGTRARSTLLLVQTSLCTTLVVLAGLFLGSLSAVRRLDLGVDLSRSLLVSVDLRGLGANDQEILAFYQRAAELVRAIPGVANAGYTVGAPFLSNMGRRIRVPGRDSLPRLAGGGPYYFAVGPGALQAYGVRLIAGRLLGPSDRKGSPPVAVVSERMANTIWPGQSALGKCFVVMADSLACREVVGVIANVHRQGLEEDPFFLYFTVLEQEPSLGPPQWLLVNPAPGATDLPATIRRVLSAERADLPYVQIRAYEGILEEQSRPWRLGASLLAVFASLSLLIAGIGLYGVVAFAVSQRTRELGLRSALGASPGRLLKAVIASGLTTSVAGVVLGIGAAAALSSRIEPLLFRTRATNPVVFGIAAVVVVLVSLGAAWLPGRRATRLDPVIALRTE